MPRRQDFLLYVSFIWSIRQISNQYYFKFSNESGKQMREKVTLFRKCLRSKQFYAVILKQCKMFINKYNNPRHCLKDSAVEVLLLDWLFSAVYKDSRNLTPFVSQPAASPQFAYYTQRCVMDIIVKTRCSVVWLQRMNACSYHQLLYFGSCFLFLHPS